MEETGFKENFQMANDLYRDGKYSEAIHACFLALNYVEGDEEKAVVLNRRGWAARYDGFKSEEEKHKEEVYEMAGNDWRAVLELSSNIDLKISAIKGLMLLPGEDTKRLCQIGMTNVDNHAKNLKAEIRNSFGLSIKEKDPRGAISIFRGVYSTVEKGTTIAGHLMQNIGTCWLILKNREKALTWKISHATKAIECFEIAMKEYPKDQVEHRRSTQGKIDRTKEEIEEMIR